MKKAAPTAAFSTAEFAESETRVETLDRACLDRAAYMDVVNAETISAAELPDYLVQLWRKWKYGAEVVTPGDALAAPLPGGSYRS